MHYQFCQCIRISCFPQRSDIVHCTHFAPPSFRRLPRRLLLRTAIIESGHSTAVAVRSNTSVAALYSATLMSRYSSPDCSSTACAICFCRSAGKAPNILDVILIVPVLYPICPPICQAFRPIFPRFSPKFLPNFSRIPPNRGHISPHKFPPNRGHISPPNFARIAGIYPPLKSASLNILNSL